MINKKAAVLLGILLIIFLFYILDLGQYLSLETFRAQKQQIDIFTRENTLAAGIGFFLTYIVITGLSLPGAAIMTLIGGALFGLLWGTIIVSFASTIGASIAFLLSRFVFRDYIQAKFSRRLKTVNEGIEKDGAYYLFTLRLIPVFPFFVINLVMGLAPMRLVTFFFVSQLGMLPGTLVYVNAGTQLARIENVRDIVSPELVFAFVLLGIFPLLARWLVNFIRNRKVYKPYIKPARFDRNLIVIGAGSAGLVCAYIAAAVKAKVTLIEKNKMGGDCLNTGCVPSKALIRSARFLSQIRRAREFGIRNASVDYDFADIMQRVQRVIQTIEPHDSTERYTKLGVECIQGEAKINSPWCVSVNGREITSRSLIIATGASPAIPPIDGLDEVEYLTSDTLWGLQDCPQRLIVLGGGPIGSELAQCFAPRILPREDPDISAIVHERFVSEGINVLTGHIARRVKTGPAGKTLVCETQGETVEIPFDQILVAVGRSAHTRGFGLEELDLSLTEHGTIAVNRFMQTNYPNIYACGDVAGPYQFTHTAAHQAWYATVNALFGRFKKFRADYRVIPWCTFTDPEVARVGLNELEARENSIDYEVTQYDIGDLDRAIADEAAHGVVKVITVPGKDTILGVTIAGDHAGDLITEYISAMRNNIGLNRILSTIHIYPTMQPVTGSAAMPRKNYCNGLSVTINGSGTRLLGIRVLMNNHICMWKRCTDIFIDFYCNLVCLFQVQITVHHQV